MSTDAKNVRKNCEIVENKNLGAAKRNADKFSHFYKEKIYYISKRNNQTLCTGYKPDSTGDFKLRIRLDDHRYGDHLTLTLFQFVNLLRDLKKLLSTEGDSNLREECRDTIIE